MKLVNLNKEQLNSFLRAQEHSSFLQSWEWGEFQESCGNHVFRLGVESDGELVMVINLIKKVLPIGRAYFYAPRFQCKTPNKECYVFFIKEIKKLAKKERVIFLRFEPLEQTQSVNNKERIVKTLDIQPSKTIILDLSRSEEELLGAMHQKTRYNIRLAERKGVEIIETACEKEDFREFWDLMKETVKRDDFRLHSREYYQRMIATDCNLNEGLSIKLFFARFDNKNIATGIFSFFGDTVTYLHGASSNDHRSVMAPYLLQWHVIKLSKGEGYRYYDFYGIDEERWPGVTRFKKGFSSRIIEYPGCFDVVFNRRWYGLYKIMRWIRRML